MLALEAIDREELRAKQHAAREIKHWTDELGMVAGTFRLEPVAGIRFVKRLERATDRCREAYPPLEEKEAGHWVACWESDRITGWPA